MRRLRDCEGSVQSYLLGGRTLDRELKKLCIRFPALLELCLSCELGEGRLYSRSDKLLVDLLSWRHLNELNALSTLYQPRSDTRSTVSGIVLLLKVAQSPSC